MEDVLVVDESSQNSDVSILDESSQNADVSILDESSQNSDLVIDESAENSDTLNDDDDPLNIIIFDESTQNSDEPTQNADEPTQNADDSTQNSDESTQNADEPTQNADDSTQNVDDSTQNADESIQNADESSQNADESTQNSDADDDVLTVYISHESTQTTDEDFLMLYDENATPDLLQLQVELINLKEKLQTHRLWISRLNLEASHVPVVSPPIFQLQHELAELEPQQQEQCHVVNQNREAQEIEVQDSPIEESAEMNAQQDEQCAVANPEQEAQDNYPSTSRGNRPSTSRDNYPSTSRAIEQSAEMEQEIQCTVANTEQSSLEMMNQDNPSTSRANAESAEMEQQQIEQQYQVQEIEEHDTTTSPRTPVFTRTGKIVTYTITTDEQNGSSGDSERLEIKTQGNTNNFVGYHILKKRRKFEEFQSSASATKRAQSAESLSPQPKTTVTQEKHREPIPAEIAGLLLLSTPPKMLAPENPISPREPSVEVQPKNTLAEVASLFLLGTPPKTSQMPPETSTSPRTPLAAVQVQQNMPPLNSGVQVLVANKMRAGEKLIPIGPKQTCIRESVLANMAWETPSLAVRKLLMECFSRQVLATHSLTGKPSPAFKHMSKPQKSQLPEDIVSDIIYCVRAHNANATEKEVRNAITTKCADENKMKRLRAKRANSKENTD